MVWQLSLAIPLPYVDKYLFDLAVKDSAKVYQLSNEPKGAAAQLDTSDNRPLRDYLKLVDPAESTSYFDVFFDDLKLLRPIRFTGLPTTSHALKTPLIFLGKCLETFSKVPRELSGGPLEFEAYLFWNAKIAPTEHQGSLIRIHGSSGTLFDPTFMRYQVSEQTRLRQITCEIFVRKGLDSALNIDRESFNNAHPHSVYITKWLHSALRQLATAQKRLAGDVRQQVRDETKEQLVSEIQQVAAELWAEESQDPGSIPPSVEISESGGKSKPGTADSYVFSRATVFNRPTTPRTPKAKGVESILEEKVKAIAQVLASFGLLDILPRKKQERLLQAISFSSKLAPLC